MKWLIFFCIHWRCFSCLSHIYLQEHFPPKHPEGKHKHDKPCILILHTRATTQFYTPLLPNHYSHEDVPPNGMTHSDSVRNIIHMPLKEFHHHPTVTQHQHHHQHHQQLLVKESPGGKHVPNRQVIQETKKKTPEPYSSMVVYCPLLLTLDCLNKRCSQTTFKSICADLLMIALFFCKKWHPTSHQYEEEVTHTDHMLTPDHRILIIQHTSHP